MCKRTPISFFVFADYAFFGSLAVYAVVAVLCLSLATDWRMTVSLSFCGLLAWLLVLVLFVKPAYTLYLALFNSGEIE